METIRRIIHPTIRIIDAQKGICDYVASDETIDSYKEVVVASGFDGSLLQKNAPVVDSHDTSTIKNLVGRLLDFRVVGRTVMERVQWAIDVPENDLAQFGWKMLAAGYLKACSIGFFPTQYLTPNSGQAWTDALKGLGFSPDAEIRMIYTTWQQVELSVCVLGANPNALAKARSDGIISDSIMEKFPRLAKRMAAGRATDYSFASATKTPSTSSRENLVNTMNLLINKSSVPTPKATYDNLEMLRRRDGSDDEINHALVQARIAVANARRHSGLDPIEQHLRQPGRRAYWMALARALKKGPFNTAALTVEQRDAIHEIQAVNKDLDASSGGSGASLFLGQAMSQDIFDLLLIYGQFRTLGLRLMEKQFTKYAKITGRPSAVFIPPTTQNTIPIPADASASRSQLIPESNYVAALLNVSLQLLEDNAVDFARLMVETFVQSLAARIDYGCFLANGVVDANNGGQTGIFLDATISTFTAAAGGTSIEQLDRSNFLGALGAINPAALQRPCSWWIHPGFIPLLSRLVDGPTGSQYLLKTPAETGDGTWRIVGFPVVWTAQTPATDGPAQTFAAFGHGDSYLVAMREEFELLTSPHPKWNTLETQYRAASRVFCQTRESTGLVKLATAPN